MKGIQKKIMMPSGTEINLWIAESMVVRPDMRPGGVVLGNILFQGYRNDADFRNGANPERRLVTGVRFDQASGTAKFMRDLLDIVAGSRISLLYGGHAIDSGIRKFLTGMAGSTYEFWSLFLIDIDLYMRGWDIIALRQPAEIVLSGWSTEDDFNAGKPVPTVMTHNIADIGAIKSYSAAVQGVLEWLVVNQASFLRDGVITVV